MKESIKEIRKETKLKQIELSKITKIPIRTIQDWEGGRREPPEYLTDLILYFLKNEGFLK